MDDDIELIPDYEEVSDIQQALEVADTTLERFLDAASVDMVFGEPIEYGSSLIIPSAELFAALGFGVGAGRFARQSGEDEAEDEQDIDDEEDFDEQPRSANAGGGGGGGRIFSRPVAVIVASPDGVVVKPVVDTTKIALAALTAAGFMFSFIFRMRRGPRG